MHRLKTTAILVVYTAELKDWIEHDTIKQTLNKHAKILCCKKPFCEYLSVSYSKYVTAAKNETIYKKNKFPRWYVLLMSIKNSCFVETKMLNRIKYTPIAIMGPFKRWNLPIEAAKNTIIIGDNRNPK